MKRSTQGGITLRTADASDARRLLALIQANLAEGHLLPRTLDELTVHAGRFVVAVRARRIIGGSVTGRVTAKRVGPGGQAIGLEVDTIGPEVPRAPG